MTIIELLKRIISQEPMQSDGWNRGEREAFMDLLLVGLYIDGKLSIQETDLLNKNIQELTASTGINWESYVSKSLHTIRSIEGDREQRHQFVQNIRERLGNFEKRHAAAQALEGLLEVDGVAAEEASFFTEVNALFRIRPLPGDEE